MKKIIMMLMLVMLAAACSSADKAKLEDKASAESNAMGDEVKKEGEGMAEEAMKMDVVDTAVKNGNFTTLVAELTETLKGPGPFTVFAPTDEAFAALPEGALEGLLKPEAKEDLKNILLYHVVSGKVMAADASTMEANSMANAKANIVKGEDGTITYAGATVTTADVDCTNGVIHVIDAVVMPPKGDATAAK